jgi:hypothetical protein
MRRSAPLQITAVSPGIYTVAQNWPKGGTWVMNLESTCGVAKAGAVVPFHGATFLRESTKLYPRFATASEVDSSLKELERGTK